MEFPGFCGGSDPHPSINVTGERSVNLYPEVSGLGDARRLILRSAPGHRPFCVMPSGPVRALWSMDGRCFAVGGNRLFELFANGTGVQRGIVATDGNPATISSNGTMGNQLLVTSAGLMYVFTLTTSAFALVTGGSVPYPVISASFSDDYFIALVRSSRRFQLSALLDGTSWNGLDAGEVSESADNVQMLGVGHRMLWFFGSLTSHPWYNNGSLSFPYEPLQGTQIDHGILAPWSLANLDNTFYFVSQDKAGSGMVVRMNGYTPERVSNHSVEYQLTRTGRLANTSAWAYQEGGHTFYVLRIPDAETTWAYDVSSGLWHERGLWDTTKQGWTQIPGRCHCHFDGRHLVGDAESGTIYEMSQAFVADEIVPSLNSHASSRNPDASPLTFDPDVFDAEVFA